MEDSILQAMYHLRTAHVPYLRTCHYLMFCFCHVCRFCSSAIEDKVENVLDVAVGDSLGCCALIVELMVPIQSRSSDGYAACS